MEPIVIDRASPAWADLESLAEHLGDGLLARGEPLGEATALVAREVVVAALTFLRDALGYQHLRSVTAVDYLRVAPRFQVVYHLLHLPVAVIAGDPEPQGD